MEQYRMEFYKNDEEIEISEMPDEYLNGVIQACRDEIASQACRDEIASRARLDRVFSRMAEKIEEEHNE